MVQKQRMWLSTSHLWYKMLLCAGEEVTSHWLEPSLSPTPHAGLWCKGANAVLPPLAPLSLMILGTVQDHLSDVEHQAIPMGSLAHYCRSTTSPQYG